MSENDTLFALAAAYQNVDDAVADYEAVKELYDEDDLPAQASACATALACLVPGESPEAERSLHDPRRALFAGTCFESSETNFRV